MKLHTTFPHPTTNFPTKFPLPISKNSLTFSKIPLSFYPKLTKKSRFFYDFPCRLTQKIITFRAYLLAKGMELRWSSTN